MNLFSVKMVLSGIPYIISVEDGLISFSVSGGEPVLLSPSEVQLLSTAFMAAINEAEESSK